MVDLKSKIDGYFSISELRKDFSSLYCSAVKAKFNNVKLAKNPLNDENLRIPYKVLEVAYKEIFGQLLDSKLLMQAIYCVSKNGNEAFLKPLPNEHEELNTYIFQTLKEENLKTMKG